MARIGIIAEDYSDVDVMYALTSKILKSNSFSFSKFVGHGCGKLQRKCGAWAKNLVTSGCKCIIIIHDRDDNNEKLIIENINRKLNWLDQRVFLILIPIEEIEAWLLYDSAALKKVFNMHKIPKLPANPEHVKSPKEFIRDLVDKNSKTTYIHTHHNKNIAQNINIERLKKCQSFSKFIPFIHGHFSDKDVI